MMRNAIVVIPFSLRRSINNKKDLDGDNALSLCADRRMEPRLNRLQRIFVVLTASANNHHITAVVLVHFAERE